jgi:uncharacterized protein
MEREPLKALINVTRLLKEPVGSSQSHDISGIIGEEEFLPISDVTGDLTPSSQEQSEGFTIDNKNILDLGELIRQYTLLNLPMKPLCRPDCPGMKEANSHGIT